MTPGLKLCIELAVFSWITLYGAVKLNKPYPWNSPVLDYVEGISFLTFVPTFLYALARGIWLL